MSKIVTVLFLLIVVVLAKRQKKQRSSSVSGCHKVFVAASAQLIENSQMDSAEKILHVGRQSCSSNHSQAALHRHLSQIATTRNQPWRAKHYSMLALENEPSSTHYRKVAEKLEALGQCNASYTHYQKAVDWRIEKEPQESRSNYLVGLQMTLLRCQYYQQMKDLAIRTLTMGYDGELGDIAATDVTNPDLTKKDHENLSGFVGLAHTWLADMAIIRDNDLDAYDQHALAALRIRKHSNAIFPYYCAAWRAHQKNHTDTHNVSEVRYVERYESEISFLQKHSYPENIKNLFQELRELECSLDFIKLTLKTHFHDFQKCEINKPCVNYSPGNFQYGTLFFDGFSELMRDRSLKAKIIEMKEHNLKDTEGNKMEFISLGSNVGNEAFYGNFEFGFPAKGYEVLCDLVTIANDLKEKHAPDADVSFYCLDALKADVSKAGIIYLDDEVWDQGLKDLMWAKLTNEVPDGCVVVRWAEEESYFQKDLEEWTAISGLIDVLASWESSVVLLQRKTRKKLGEGQCVASATKKCDDPKSGPKIDSKTKKEDDIVKDGKVDGAEVSLYPPPETASQAPSGLHLIAELDGTAFSTLNGHESLIGSVNSACAAGKLSVLNYTTHQFAPFGVSGVWLLAESHFSFHTWPEKGYMALDIFTCGKVSPIPPNLLTGQFFPTTDFIESCQWEDALTDEKAEIDPLASLVSLIKDLKPSRVKLDVIERGDHHL